MKQAPNPILLISCGNTMAGDDALGPLTTKRLRDHTLPQVDIIDLDMNPAGLLNLLPRQQALCIIDAAYVQGACAGQIIDIDWFDINRPDLAHDDVLSSHGLGISNQIDLASTLDLLPPIVWLVAMTIDPSQVGDKQTKFLKNQLDIVIDTTLQRLDIIKQTEKEESHA